MHACIHTYIHTYIHTHTHIHTYIHTYIHTFTNKIEGIQERALKFMFNDHCSTYPALLDKCSYTTLLEQ